MRASSKGKNVEKVCIPIVETTVEKALAAIKEAEPWADLIELRADYLKRVELAPFLEDRQSLSSSPIGEMKKGANIRGRKKEAESFTGCD